MTTQEFETYLESIGGLINGFYSNREPIKSRHFFSVDDGWLDLIKELIEKLIKIGWNKEICQCKEKFSRLCFYINNGTNDVHDLIKVYEEKSSTICEICGKIGKLKDDCGRNGGMWYKTLCDKHYNKLKKYRKNES